MKNEETYEEILQIRTKVLDLCEENGFPLIFMFENENEVVATARGEKVVLGSMLCAFLIESYDIEEIRTIFKVVIDLKKATSSN